MGAPGRKPTASAGRHSRKHRESFDIMFFFCLNKYFSVFHKIENRLMCCFKQMKRGHENTLDFSNVTSVRRPRIQSPKKLVVWSNKSDKYEKSRSEFVSKIRGKHGQGQAKAVAKPSKRLVELFQLIVFIWFIVFVLVFKLIAIIF